MIGISIADGAFQLVCAEPIGRRRYLDEDTVKSLDDFGRRYGKLLASNETEGLLELGRDLYRFLDGDAGQLTALIDQAPRPIHFEVAAPTCRPDQPALALSRAPWELLANEQGFIAGDDRLGFSPVRRLGHREAFPPLDRYRLGLTFMAASPQGAAELDYEAEESCHHVGGGRDQARPSGGGGRQPRGTGGSADRSTMRCRCCTYPAMATMRGVRIRQANRQANAGAAAGGPERGGELPTGAGALIGALRAYRPPRLVFLSACLTAAAGGTKVGGLAGDKEAADDRT